MKTAVVFLQNKDDLFAYFPDDIADIEGNKTAYSHMGQHSVCSPEYVRESEPATNYQDLKNELERKQKTVNEFYCPLFEEYSTMPDQSWNNRWVRIP